MYVKGILTGTLCNLGLLYACVSCTQTHTHCNCVHSLNLEGIRKQERQRHILGSLYCNKTNKSKAIIIYT